MKKFIIILIAASFIFGSIATFASLTSGVNTDTGDSSETNSSNNGEGMGLEAGKDKAKIIGDSRHIYGKADAPVTLTVFSDFECPFCATIAPNLKAIVDTYPTQFKLNFRQFPLPNHNFSPAASIATEFAFANGGADKFWLLHDRIFSNQKELSKDKIIELAKSIGLDGQALSDAINNNNFQNIINQDLADGQGLGLTGTPTVFIDDQLAKFSTVQELLTLISFKAKQTP